MISIIASSAPGLSPLARGTRLFSRPCHCRGRFIPAGAGNTTKPESFHITAAVYPRWRGEHLLAGEYAPRHAGLSPLARGTPYSFRTLHEICRFIPAGAGNTEIADSNKMEFSVYPRWRGEH
ncbi:hypothetical protein ECDEC14D_3199 [Escherichia coli DEC14D]|nr:hypothetical protein ECDEC10E_3231 [Escherichia coli DEC10E]EHX90233.1 hypothetical protein ECDEC14D_3199 [Escherichia coli DEC14D]